MARVILPNSSAFVLSGHGKPHTTSFTFKRAPIVCDAVRQVSANEARSGGTSRSFGRLKVNRVRDLVKESYRKKKQDDDDLEEDEEEAGNVPTSLPVELFDERDRRYDSKTSNVERYIPRGVRDDVRYDQKTSSVERYIPRGVRDDVRSGGRARSSSKAAVGSSKKWGGVESTDSYRPYTEDVSRKWKIVKATNDFFSRKSFEELGCGDYMIKALGKLQYSRPSHIQAMTFEPIIGGKSCIMADQSGSGKTLAYLAPLVQRLRQEELEGLGRSVAQNPRVVILVPTAELGSQVLSNCRSLSRAGVRFSSMVATGGFRQKTQLDTLKQELDVVVATPGRFMFLVKEGFLQLTNLRSAVLDEVDILFNDEDFELALQTLINSAPVTTQYLFVTATLPLEIYNKLVENFPDCEVIMGPGMHRTSTGLDEILIDCSGDDNAERTPDTAFLNKKNALLRIHEESPVSKTIVFCNKIETCRKVENALKRLDRRETHIKVLPFHAALDQESRLANIKEFRNRPLENVSMFLVCTDRASRGIDFEGVDHVVLFDYPRDPSEYVRRVGRTARGAGNTGTAFVFAVGKQVSLANRIIERNRKGHPLHDVPSAYEVMR